MSVTELAANWASEWENNESMAFFLMEELDTGGVFRVYVLNKDTLKMYHVVDFPISSPDFEDEFEINSCVYSRGKLYLIGDRASHDVHVCDISSSSPPYVWTRGPPMRNSKHNPHLVAYHGLIFSLSTPDFCNHRVDPILPMATFEVWDTSRLVPSWEVLPDPPLKDYNIRQYGLYVILSHAIVDDLFYFVFDYTDVPSVVSDKDSLTHRIRPSSVCTKVLTFDPKLRQWGHSSIDDDDHMSDDDDDPVEAYDMLSLYIDFSARRHQGGVKVIEFFKGDPSLRMFLIDPTGDTAMLPCFYTYDRSNFDQKTMVNAVREFCPPCVSDMKPQELLTWFQAFVRPYLSSVTGLSNLMEILMSEPDRGRNSFVLPCSYEDSCWTFCVVAFINDDDDDDPVMAVVAKFRLRLRMNSFFHAEDFEMQVNNLPNTADLPHAFSRVW